MCTSAPFKMTMNEWNKAKGREKVTIKEILSVCNEFGINLQIVPAMLQDSLIELIREFILLRKNI